jgi:hypothetical protein
MARLKGDHRSALGANHFAESKPQPIPVKFALMGAMPRALPR